MRATFRAILLSAAVAVPVLAIAACDETIEPTKAAPTADAASDATTGGDAGPSLFDQLGGEKGVAALIDAVVAAEVADPEIAAFFAPNASSPPAAGHPSVVQIKECFTKQVSAALGGKDSTGKDITYPTKVSGDYQCRDMAAAHAALHISSAVYDKFSTIAAGVAQKANLPAEALSRLTSFLQLNKTLIVDPNAGTDAGSDAAKEGGTDSGGGSDASTDAPADGG